jgi:hypothetical protein
VTIAQAWLGCEAVFKEKPKTLMGLEFPPPPILLSVVVPLIAWPLAIFELLQVILLAVEVLKALPVGGLESQYRAHSIPALAAKMAWPDSLLRLASATCLVERVLMEKAIMLSTPATITAANMVNPFCMLIS